MMIDEIRAIREKTSLETIGMTIEELRQYFAKGAAEIEGRIVEIRNKKGIVMESSWNDDTGKTKQKSEHAYIRGAEYYADLSKVDANSNAERYMTVSEPTENYDRKD